MKLQMILTVVCVLSIAVNSFGCVLFGSVKDENGKPIDGAKVKVYGKTCYGFTNSKGEFRIDNDELIDGGRYSVTVTAKGYDSGQTLATEVFEDPEEAEALEVTMYKEEPIPEPTAASTNVSDMMYGNVTMQNTNDASAVEDYTSDLIDTAEKEIIDAEDKSTPLSDKDLQDHFQRNGTHIARRTISKYRQNQRPTRRQGCAVRLPGWPALLPVPRSRQ